MNKKYIFAVGIWLLLIHASNFVDAGTQNSPFTGPVRSQKEAKIVGGVNAEIEDYPWQVSLQSKGEILSHFCGGSIINQEWVITASHCVTHMDPEDFFVVAGITNKGNAEEHQKYRVAEIIMHDEYDSQAYSNDIALIRLSNRFDFNNPLTQPIIPLNRADVAIGLADPGTLAKITGWGDLYYEGPDPDTLQLAEVPVMAIEQTNFTSDRIGPGMILAGTDSTSGCQGDSGGPLVVSDNNGSYKLAGATSWGYDCALAGYPGVYTRMSYYESWISERINLQDSNKYQIVWLEGFEPGAEDGFLPAGWQVKRNTPEDGGLNGNNLQETQQEPWFKNSHLFGPDDAREYVRSGEASMVINENAPGFTWAISPDISLPANLSEPELVFYNLKKTSTPIVHINVLHNGQWATLPINESTPGSFEMISASLQDYSGSTIQIAIISENTGGSGKIAIDDIAIRSLNPSLDVQFVVNSQQHLLDSAMIQINGRTVVDTDEQGIASSTLYPGGYNIKVFKPGYFIHEQTIDINVDQQVIEILLEKIPVPEITINKYQLDLTLQQGQVLEDSLLISNPGELSLDYSAGIYPALQPGSSIELLYDSNPVHPSSAMGTNGAASRISAVRFTAEELADYYGSYSLSGIKYHLMSDDFERISLMVWVGNGSPGPGTLLFEQDVTQEVNPGVWNTHILQNNIELIPGEEYWIGYSLDTDGNGHPLTIDNGPMVEDRGGWYLYYGEWITLADHGFDYNWCIRGFITPDNGSDWIEIDNATGTVDPGAANQMMLQINTANMETGNHHASLVINNNTGKPAIVPVSLSVETPLSDVLFIIKDENDNVLTEAIISVNDVDNIPGDYFIQDIEPGVYQYSVQNEGYHTANGQLKISGENIECSINLIPDYLQVADLEFLILDEFESPVDQAVIKLENNGTFLTNAEGLASAAVVHGDHYFQVSAEGMVEHSSELIIPAEINSFQEEVILQYLYFNVDAAVNDPLAGTVSGTGNYYHGQQVNVEAIPETGYHFLYWEENGKLFSASPEISFTALKDRQLKAHFNKNRYKIEIIKPENGVVSPSGNIVGELFVEYNSEVTFTFVPDEGHYISDVLVDNQSVGIPENYTFSNISENHTLEVEFAIFTYTLTIIQNENGEIKPYSGTLTPEGTMEAEYGSQKSFLIQPDPGYFIQDVLVDGESIGQVQAHSFVDITSDHSLEAIFETSSSTGKPIDTDKLIIFPNPTSSHIFVSADTKVLEVLLFNQAGQLVLRKRNPGEDLIHLTGIPTGLYLVEITTLNGTFYNKLIIQK